MEDLSQLAVELSLRSTFSDLVTRLHASPTVVQKWTRDLIEQYTEPQRHYHTINHVHSMLSNFKQDIKLIKSHEVMELAICFHDWIYDPQAKDNEVQSANCFRVFADEIKLDNIITEKVANFIERTITHTLPHSSNVAEPDSDLCLFLDFDLEVLSRTASDYKRYARQIRQEYSHFNDSVYCAGRIKALKSFLGRERLYFSERFYKRGEVRARENLREEIASLERELVEVSRGR